MRISGAISLLALGLFAILGSCRTAPLTGNQLEAVGLQYRSVHDLDLSQTEIAEIRLSVEIEEVESERTFVVSRSANGDISGIRFSSDSGVEKDLVSGISSAEILLGEILIKVEYLSQTGTLRVEYTPHASGAGIDIARL